MSEAVNTAADLIVAGGVVLITLILIGYIIVTRDHDHEE